MEPPGSLGERSAWVQRDGTQIHLMFTGEPTVPPQGHAAVVAGDYDAPLSAPPRPRPPPAERGAPRGGPEGGERHWGAPRPFVRTPAGHRVEVMAAPPPR